MFDEVINTILLVKGCDGVHQGCVKPASQSLLATRTFAAGFCFYFPSVTNEKTMRIKQHLDGHIHIHYNKIEYYHKLWECKQKSFRKEVDQQRSVISRVLQ